MSILEAIHVHKTYRLGRVEVPVLRGVDLTVQEGEWVAVLGASGSGKSTLLHLLGGLDRPDRQNRGDLKATPTSIAFRGRRLDAMSGGERDRYRAGTVGFVFQFYHLLPELTALENVLSAAMVRAGFVGYLGQRGALRAKAKSLLTDFGLGDRLGHRSVELSGGERQRVAIARALVNGPDLLLADEPTGNLDRTTGDQILGMLAAHRERTGQTLVMVTHDMEVAARADRIITLRDGLVVDGRVGAEREIVVPVAVNANSGVPGASKSTSNGVHHGRSNGTGAKKDQPG